MGKGSVRVEIALPGGGGGGGGVITRVNFNQYSNSLSTKNYYHELSNSLLVCVFILEILFSELMGGVNKGEPLWLTL